MAFSIFYLLPVSAVAWACGLRRAVAVSAVAALAWCVADLAAGADYSTLLVPLWNSASRFGVFVIVAVLLAHLQRALDAEQRLSRIDPLTGVANSRWFSEQAAALACDTATGAFTLTYIDLDDFKSINDRYGHTGGDEVLRRVGNALRHAVRSTDLVGRMGGDEFTVAFVRPAGSDLRSETASIVARIRTVLTEVDSPVGFSAAAVTFAPAPSSIDSAVTAADRLMYEVKRDGKYGFAHRLCEGAVVSWPVNAGTGSGTDSNS